MATGFLLIRAFQITLCTVLMCSVMSDSLWPHGLQPSRLLCTWNSPGKSTGVDCHTLLQGIFPTQGSNSGFGHCRRILYHLNHQGTSLSNSKYIIHTVHYLLWLINFITVSFYPLTVFTHFTDRLTLTSGSNHLFSISISLVFFLSFFF